MYSIILQAIGVTTNFNFNLLYLMLLALIALIGYYLSLRFNWLKPVNLKDRRNLTSEINEEIPRMIIIDNELWQIIESNKIKEFANGWARNLTLQNNTGQLKTDFIVTSKEIDLDKTGDEIWNGSSIIFRYNKEGSKIDSEKDRIIEQQNLKIASLIEELKIANAGIDVQIKKRIKEQAIARSAGTSLGYPSSDRVIPDDRDI